MTDKNTANDDGQDHHWPVPQPRIKVTKLMSQIQYNQIEKARLIDLPMIPSGLLIQWLVTKPDWLQQRVFKQLTLQQ